MTTQPGVARARAGKGDREVEAPVMIDKLALEKWVIR